MRGSGRVVRRVLACVTLVLSLGTTAWAADCEGMDGLPGDLDGDGHLTAGGDDCDDTDPGVWVAAGEVTGVTSPPGALFRLAWDTLADLGGLSPNVTFEVLRSPVASNFLTHPGVVCLDTGSTDTQMVDPVDPTPGGIFYYHPRARTECGAGSLGTTSSGVVRLGRECDCAQLCDDGNACTVDSCGNGTCLHDAAPPQLLRAPSSTYTCDGGTVRFEVDATGSGTLHYEWRLVGLPTGSDSRVLELNGLTPAANGSEVTVTVTDACSNVTSPPALLTVFSNQDSCDGGLDGPEAPNGAGEPAAHAVGRNWAKFRTNSGGDFSVGGGGIGGVHLHSGEVYLDATDLHVAGRGMDFDFTRHYQSREWISTAMGVGWTHAYDRRIQLDTANPGHVLVWGGDGRIDSFAPNGLGCYEAPGFFEELCPQPDGSHVLTFPDRTTWTLAPLDGSPAEGMIVQARDRFGNAMSFAYDGSGKLVTILDTLDRTITLAYNARNLIESVTDFIGRQWSYEYYDGVEFGGEQDDLKSVTSPPVTGTPTGNEFAAGKTVVYTYSQGSPIGELNHNLLSVKNGNGDVVVLYAYTTTQSPADPMFDRATQQRIFRFEIPDREVHTYVAQTPSPANNFAVSQTIVNSSGNLGEYFFDADGDLVMERMFTGRCPSFEPPVDAVFNRPVGQLRLYDPPFFETRYEHDANHLVTRVVQPNGNEVELSYDSANPSARKRGDLLSATYLPGPLGGDQPSITQSWVHATDLGTVWSARDGHAIAIGHDYARSIRAADFNRDGIPDVVARGGEGGGGSADDTQPDLAVRVVGGGLDGRGSHDPNGSDARSFADHEILDHVDVDLLHSTGIPYNSPEIRGLELLRSSARNRRCDDDSDSDADMRKGWDGTIKGNPRHHDDDSDSDADMRKGWDGTIKGNPRHHDDDSDSDADMRKGWDGTIKGNPRHHDTNSTDDRHGFHSVGGTCASDDVVATCGSRVAVPRFLDLTAEAKRAAEQADVGAIRSGILHAVGHTSRGDVGAIRSGIMHLRSFPTSHTDPNGSTWTLVYGPTGELTDLVAPPVVTGTLSGGVQVIHHQWAYNAFGQVTQYTSPTGRIDRMTYYTSGPQTGYPKEVIVDDPVLHLLTVVAYDDLGRVTRLTNPRGIHVDLVYNTLDQVVRVSHGSLPYGRDLYYDAANHMVRTDVRNVDETGTLRPNAYLTSRSSFHNGDIPIEDQFEIGPGECVTEQYEWEPHSVLWRSGAATSGEQPTNVTRVLFDERGLRFRVVDAEGDPVDVSTRQYDYDPNSNLAARHVGLEDPSGTPDTTLYEYDGYNRRIRRVDAHLNTRTTHYDPAGNPVSRRLEGEAIDGVSGTVVLLRETFDAYDEVHRRIRTDEAHFDVSSGTPIGDGVSTERTYFDESSRVIRVEDDNGHGLDLSYDTAGRLHQLTDAMGNSVTRDDDENSNVTRVTAVELSDLGGPPEVFTVDYDFDELDRRTAVVDGAGPTVEFDYDSSNVVVRMIDQLGNVTRHTYDGMRRPVVTETDLTDTGTGSGTVVATHVTTQSWDDSSRLRSSTDANGNPTEYTYDPRDRMVSYLRADEGTFDFAWDTQCDLVTSTDPNSSVRMIEHDRLGRLVSSTISLGPGVTGTTTESYLYDGASRLVLAQDDDTLVTRSHDSLSNVLVESQGIGASPPQVVSSTWDGVSNRTSLTYPSGLTVTYTHDALDRVKLVFAGPALVASYDYAGPRRPARVSLANGVHTDYSYDGSRRISSKIDTGSGPLLDQSFLWSPASNLLVRTSSTATHESEYDSLHRLVKLTRTPSGSPPETLSYTLDLEGNRQLAVGGPDPGPYMLDPTLPDPADYQVHQYTSTPSGDRVYDQNGNTLVLFGGTADERTFHWNYRGQITEATFGGSVSSFGHDVFGRVLASSNGGNTENWSFRGGRELSYSVGGTPNVVYIYGGLGERLQMIEQVDLNSNLVLDTYYYHTDDAGSVMAMSDTSGTVVERYDYLPGGVALYYDGAGTPLGDTVIHNRHLYQGRLWDGHLSLYRFGASGYDPRDGRVASGVSVGGPWGGGGGGGGTEVKYFSVKVGKDYYICMCDQWGLDPEIECVCWCATCDTN